jgi:glycosyltransferase involved in cell wall biosynthesis
MNRPIRIALPPIGGVQWLGGQNYLRNLAKALLEFVPHRVTPVLFVDPDYAPAMVAELEQAGVEIVRDPYFSPARQGRRIVRALITGRDAGALRRYRAQRIDCVFESANYHGWRFGMPTLAWFPDFQHRHLPHLFSRQARLRREAGFRAAIARSEHLLLSSRDAEADLRRYYSNYGATAHVVPFAVPVPPPATAESVSRVRRQYDLPERWFHLPNQFWRHKNHAVVVEAVQIAAREMPDICVCCTGSAVDIRDPGYFEGLMTGIAARGLQAHFISLGIVPHADVHALMQGSIALINPSLFEGWSTVVEEAKASGTPMILSSINVHREQAGESARYFDPAAPEELAAILMDWHRSPPSRSRDDRHGALRSFAEGFADAVAAAARHPRR